MLASTAIRRLASRNALRRSSPLLSRFMSSDDLPYHIIHPMPALSPTMEAGTLASWSLKEGDSFGAGDVIAKIETDKASIDFEAQDDGVIAKLLIPDGSEDVVVGHPIMVTVEDEDDVAAFKDFSVPSEAAAVPPPPAEEETAAESVASPEPAATPPPIEEAVVAAAPEPVAAIPETVAATPATVASTMGPAWGSSARVTSAIAKTLSASQKEYVEKYGTTGQLPL